MAGQYIHRNDIIQGQYSILACQLENQERSQQISEQIGWFSVWILHTQAVTGQNAPVLSYWSFAVNVCSSQLLSRRISCQIFLTLFKFIHFLWNILYSLLSIPSVVAPVPATIWILVPHLEVQNSLLRDPSCYRIGPCNLFSTQTFRKFNSNL